MITEPKRYEGFTFQDLSIVRNHDDELDPLLAWMVLSVTVIVSLAGNVAVSVFAGKIAPKLDSTSDSYASSTSIVLIRGISKSVDTARVKHAISHILFESSD